jgi:uncharacterized repeat protein (TIGR01451 family)
VFGQYDPVGHTYTWSYPYLAAGEGKCVDLVVQVDKDVKPGTTITNEAMLDSSQTPTARDTSDVVVGYPPLELRKTITDPIRETDDRGRVALAAGEKITYSLCFRNASADKTITHIQITDTLPRETRFASADGDEDFGFYDPNTHTYTWFYPPLAPGEEACLDLVVQVQPQTEPNTVIVNEAVIQSRQTGAGRARVDAIVSVQPMAAQLFLKPTRIFRDNTTDGTILATVYLPEGHGKELIADVPLVMEPGSIQATGQTIFGTRNQGKVLCLFDTAAFLAATDGYGEFTVTVTGTLVSGRIFRAEETITILDFYHR